MHMVASVHLHALSQLNRSVVILGSGDYLRGLHRSVVLLQI